MSLKFSSCRRENHAFEGMRSRVGRYLFFAKIELGFMSKDSEFVSQA